MSAPIRQHAAPVAPLAEQDYSPDLEAALAASFSLKGDVSGLSPQDREAHYIKLCRALRLNPLTQPLQWLRLNGKEVLYVARGATDQLAALNRLTRETVRGPEVVDIGGTKVGLCVVKVTLPDGRSETAHATLPAADPVNLYMKLETKAKRRATLSILGLGILDETELETIPASERAPSALGLDPRPEEPPAPSTTWSLWLSELAAADTLSDVRAVYLALADQLRAAGEDPTERLSDASRAVTERVSALGYRVAAAELREMLQPTPAGGTLCSYSELIHALEPGAENAAHWWRSQRASVPAEMQDTVKRLLARHIATSQDAAGTRAAGLALKAALARLDAPPPSGGGAPAPEAPQSTTAQATREPGDDSESEAVAASADWQRTAEGREAHAATLAHPRAVLASARKHCDLPGYARVLAARLVALEGTDAQGTVLSDESALAMVNGAMARAQADRRAARDAARRAA